MAISADLYELFTAREHRMTSNRVFAIYRKEGKTNGLHDSLRFIRGDGDDAAPARNPLRAFRSLGVGTETRTATSAHELGRGHRQNWQPAAPHAVGGLRNLDIKLACNIPLTMPT